MIKKIIGICFFIGVCLFVFFPFQSEMQVGFQKRLAFFQGQAFIPRRITIKWPYQTDIFRSFDGKKYCGEGTGYCGTIEVLDESHFKMHWMVADSEVYEQESYGVYLRKEDENTIKKMHATTLPEQKAIRIRLSDIEQTLFITKDGQAFDEQQRFVGTLQAFLYITHEHKQEKEALVFVQDNIKKIFVKENDVYIPQNTPLEHKRFLLGMSSYKRPIFASGQVLRLFNQTYSDFDMHVVLKGVDGADTAYTLLKEWTPYINANRLRVHFEPNKRQFSNWLDTFRYEDLEKYDYVCKIDDDDWYAPEHMENLNLYLNLDSDILYTATTNYYELSDNIQTAYYTYNGKAWNGNTLCLHSSIARKLLHLEKLSDSQLLALLPEAVTDMDTYKKIKEDLLIETLFKDKGKSLYYQTIIPTVIYNRQYPSVTQKRKAYMAYP